MSDHDETLHELLRQVLAELRDWKRRALAPAVSVAAPPAVELANHPLAAWLAARGFRALTCQASPLVAGIFDQVALAFGHDYAVHAALIRQLRRATTTRSPARLALAGVDAAQRERVLATCQMLEDCGLVHDFHLVHGIGAAVLVPSLAPELVAFFAGGWLERFLLLEVRRLRPELAPGDFLANVVVEDHRGAMYEIDLLLADGKEPPLLFECKAGAWNHAPQRLATLADHLGIGRERVVFVAPAGGSPRKAEGLGMRTVFAPFALAPLLAPALLRKRGSAGK